MPIKGTKQGVAMWKISLCCNLLVLVVLWLLAMVIMELPYNHLVQYSKVKQVLPSPTELCFQLRPFSVALPLLWIVFTILWGRRMVDLPRADRNEYLILHTSTTIFAGFGTVLFFALGAILPFLYIGSSV